MERTIFDGIRTGANCYDCSESDRCPAFKVATKLVALHLGVECHIVTPRLAVHTQPAAYEEGEKVRTSLGERIEALEGDIAKCEGGTEGVQRFDLCMGLPARVEGSTAINVTVIGIATDTVLADLAMRQEEVPLEIRHSMPTPRSAPVRTMNDYRASQVA